MNATMFFDSRVFPYQEKDTIDPGVLGIDLPDILKNNFMKTIILNIAKTDPIFHVKFP